MKFSLRFLLLVCTYVSGVLSGFMLLKQSIEIPRHAGSPSGPCDLRYRVIWSNGRVNLKEQYKEPKDADWADVGGL